MGGLVACQGNQAQIPYYIESIGKHIYTIEELCYYVWQYVHLLEPGFVDKALAEWIEVQLGLGKLSEVLKQKLQANADMEELVLCILEYVCYLGPEELEEYQQQLKRTRGMSAFERKKCKADDLVRTKRYYKALAEYRRLLKAEEAEDDVAAGSIYHNMGVAYSRMFFFEEACECFLKAFLAAPDKERMRQYKLAVRLCKNKMEEDELVREFPSSSSMDMQVYEELEAVRREENPKLEEVDNLWKLKEEGKIAQFYKQTEQLLQRWSDECREYMHE